MVLKKFFKRLEEVLEIRNLSPIPTKADVVIGLGFGLSLDGFKLSPQGKIIAMKAFKIAKERNLPLIFSGGYYLRPGLTESRLMSEFVNANSAVLEENSWRTYGNADEIIPIMKQNSWKRALIICQQWHARRVRATFGRRWHAKGIQFWIMKANCPYGNNSHPQLGNFWKWAIFDGLAWANTKLRGFC
ncbi:YdcF family protein [Patescibacteria group bacterium]|nr:YdcF family protein [Patescibacteria group bacterium]